MTIRIQKQFRIETFQGLQDYVSKRCADEGVRAGKIIILPKSFKGSPRDMAHTYQNAMCIVQNIGMPTYFMTVTMNSQLIQEFIDSYENVFERVDLADRYFELLICSIMEDFDDQMQVLGKKIGHVLVKEFQKRGSKHAHIVFIMEKDDVPLTSEDIDKIICAEIPDPITDETMHKLVMSQMIHGPCGHRNPHCVCMEERQV